MSSRKQIAQLTTKDYALFFSHFLAYFERNKAGIDWEPWDAGCMQAPLLHCLHFNHFVFQRLISRSSAFHLPHQTQQQILNIQNNNAKETKVPSHRTKMSPSFCSSFWTWWNVDKFWLLLFFILADSGTFLALSYILPIQRDNVS